jgi:hypothetical protein
LYPSRDTWSPRFGFAYAIDEKTVFRGGFGLYVTACREPDDCGVE